MIIDSRRIADGTTLEADVCVIGAGPAGITLAQALARKSIRVVLLEGGGLKRNRASQDLYKGDVIGLDYDPLHRSRSRYFGGSSNCWGGFCCPLEPMDFEARDWVPNSGWPIRGSELTPYYERAHSLLELGPFDYDPDRWQSWIGTPNAQLLPFANGRIANKIAQLSPPTRFGKTYLKDIAACADVTACLGANVTELEAPDTGSNVRCVHVRTFAGNGFRVTAQAFVLAAGGIETPRLLLTSNRHQPAGIGNLHDNVGRYFMDHPRLKGGIIRFRSAKHRAIYDMHLGFKGDFRARGVKIAPYLGLSSQVQREERIGNARCYVVPRYWGERPPIGKSPSHRKRPRQSAILRDHISATVAKIGRRLPTRLLARDFRLETIVEPTPLRDSRVTLSPNRDRLGMPQICLDWKLSELDTRTMLRTQQVLAHELQHSNAGELTIEAPGGDGTWEHEIVGCWHHMGTTRMDTDPRKGVVDANCRVHGTANLFIAGSSVFPTSGCDMPTITIVAMSLRLAGHVHAFLSRQISLSEHITTS